MTKPDIPYRNYMTRTMSGQMYRAAAILTFNTLLIFGCLELIGATYLRIPLAGSERPDELKGEETPRETVSYYASEEWAKRYWYEFRLSRKQQFYAYVGWRRAPFKGKTIEVDANGIRVTPGAECGPNAFKVFTFGASEMWGTGAPTWGTIPAHLQKGLEKIRRGPVCVTNFAESAYVSMQSIIMLLMQLRSGHVPDVVVFYTLTDDVYAAYQSGRAGVIENLDQIAARFEGRREPETFLDWLRRTSSYRLIDRIMAKLTLTDPLQVQAAATPSTYESKGIDADTLSELIVKDYFASYKIVSALADDYGFKYFYFVPPLISQGSKALSPEEQDMKHRAENQAALFRLSTAVYRAIEREGPKYPNLYSMVHLFDPYDSLVFIDESHVTPVGNQLIADEMLKVIEDRSWSEHRMKTASTRAGIAPDSRER